VVDSGFRARGTTPRRAGLGSRLLALAIASVLVGACTNAAATATPAASVAPAPSVAASAAPSAAASAAAASAAPSAAASAAALDGTGLKVGYISLGDSVPFVKLVSDGIKAEAAKAHLDFQFCDAQIDAAKALACAQNFKLKGVQGVLNFQVDQKSSPEICAAYGGVPTIAIDIVQKPCQIAFMGANNAAAGKLGGEALGKYAKDKWNCDYTAYVSLESSAAGDANAARMGGWRTGFTEFCPIKNEHILDPADRTDSALPAVTSLLPALPGHRIVVVAINEDGILGAEGAAKTLGRSTDLFYGGQGTDPSIWKDVACNPNYIVSIAYFPERYGTLLIPNIIAALKGQTIPPLIYTQHIVINKDNIRTIYPATPAC
jgi:ribose transport system substrate-binding protein